jgi:radical SAM family uncharacterized protein/radical SAM-linked protein
MNVERPARYVAAEANLPPVNTGARLSFCLTYPDLYEVGMSNQGLLLLYHALTQREEVRVERAFCPWLDREKQLRECGESLRSLETETPLADFDLLGFSLQTELVCTNILTMLDLAGIPLRSSARDETHPICLGGGHGCVNPEPMAPFLDALVIGDGEEVILKITACVLQAKEKGLSREATLLRLAGIAGVYVPRFYACEYNEDGTLKSFVRTRQDIPERIERCVVDLEKSPYPSSPLVPHTETIHDRIAIEVKRGCTQGCRFCQAGYITRPIRERQPDTIVKLAREALSKTGQDEVSLLSLSTSDYSGLARTLEDLLPAVRGCRANIALPSLRIDSFPPKLASTLAALSKKGLTFAPECASPRLQRVINKNISKETILNAIRSTADKGWQQVKLYFMIGLPSETEEDALAIIDMTKAIRGELINRAGKRSSVTVAISPFVPKPHTPFQWEAQLPREELNHRAMLIKDGLRGRGFKVNWHDTRKSRIEACLARGDRRVADVIQTAWESGCRFEEWSESFNYQSWEKAFEDNGLSMEFYANRTRDVDELLPWQHIFAGVELKFLKSERERAFKEVSLHNCTEGKCYMCGACPEGDGHIMAQLDENPSEAVEEKSAAEPVTTTYRVRYQKKGKWVWISHLDLLTQIHRVLRRSGLPLDYTRGYSPRPRTAFSDPRPVGQQGMGEYMDVSLTECLPARCVLSSLAEANTPDLVFTHAAELEAGTPKIGKLSQAHSYEITIEALSGELPEASIIEDKLSELSELESFCVPTINRKTKEECLLDIIASLVTLLLLSHSGSVACFKLVLRTGGGRLPRPENVVRHALGLQADKCSVRVTHRDILFEEKGKWRPILDG